MTYNLFLVQVAQGSDPAAAAVAFIERNVDAVGPPVPEIERRKREMAAAVTALVPELVHQPYDFARIAREAGIPEERLRSEMRELMLTADPDDPARMCVILYDDAAEVSIPCWEQDVEGRRRFDETWDLLRMLEAKGEFATYDPLLGRPIDLRSPRDREAVLREYGRWARSHRRFSEWRAGTRPWWKFW